MELTQIKSILDQHTNEFGQLLLNPALFPEIDAFLAPIFNPNFLILVGEIGVETEAVILKGKTNFLDIDQVFIELSFKPKENELLLAMVVELPLNWNFGQSFPVLPPSYKSNGKPEDGYSWTYQDSLLTDLVFRKAQFILRNFENEVEPHYRKGLNFSGFPANFDELSPLNVQFPVDASTQIAGHITPYLEGSPDFDLKLLFEARELEAGPLKIMNFHQRIRNTFPPISDYEETRLEAAGEIVLGTNNPLRLEIATPLYKSSGLYNFYGLSPDQSASLTNVIPTLASAMGIDASDLSLPEQLGVIEQASLHYIACKVDGEERKVLGFDIAVGLPVLWEILDPQLVMSDLILGISVLNPQDQEKRQIALRVTGTFLLGLDSDVHIDATALLGQDIELIGQLRQGETLPIQAAVAAMTGQHIDLPDDLEVNRLNLHTKLKEKTFLFQFGIQGEWAFFPDEMDLSLQRLYLEIRHQVAGEQQTTAVLSGQLRLSGLDLFAKAERAGADIGWILEAHTGQDQTIHLTQLALDLANELNVAYFPEMPEIELRNLGVSMETHSKAFEVWGESMTATRLPFGEIELDLFSTIVLKSTRDPVTRERGMTGAIRAEIEIAGQIFALSISLDDDEDDSIHAAWAGQDDKVIGINDILEGLGLDVVEIPDEIDLKLKSVVIEYDVDSNSIRLMAASTLFGKVFFVSQKDKISKKRVQVLGLEFPPDFQLSDIPGLPEEVSQADFLSFNRTAIIIASQEVRELRIPQMPLLAQSGELATAPFVSDEPLHLLQGLNVSGRVDLDSTSDLAVKNLQSSTGLKELIVQAAVGKKSLSFRANLPAKVGFQVGADYLEFKKPHVRFDIFPNIGIQIVGAVALEMNNMTLLAEGGLVISTMEASARLMLSAQKSDLEDADANDPGTANLLEPLGIRGLQLNDVGLIIGATFVPAGVKFGFQSRFAIGDQEAGSNDMAIVLQVIPAVPSPVVNVQLLTFALAEIDIETALTVFTNGNSPKLPQELRSIRVTDAGFYYCQTLVMLPDGNTATPGFGFNGNVDLFGFKARAKLMVSALSGIEGHFQLPAIELKLGNKRVFALSGKGKELAQYYEMKEGKRVKVDNNQKLLAAPSQENEVALIKEVIVPGGGPVFEFNTFGPRFLYASMEVSFLDLLGQRVEAEISTAGIKFMMQYYISDVFQLDIHFTLSTAKEDFGVYAYAGFRLDLDIDIDLPSIGDLDLGSFRLDAELNAGLEFRLNAKDGFYLSITGSFEFEGTRFDLPKIEIHVPVATLKDLGEKIIQHIKDEAGEIFSDMFNEMEELWEDAKQEVTELYEDAKEEIEEIGKETVKAAEAMVEHAETALKEVEKVGKELGEEIENAEKVAKEMATETAEKVLEIGTAAAEEAEELVGEAEAAFEDAAKKTEELAQETQQFVENVGEEIEEIGTVALKKTEELAQEALEETKEILEDAEEVAKEALNIARQAARKIEEAAEELEKLAQKVLQEVEALLKKAEEELRKALKEVEKTAKKAVNEVKKGAEKTGKEVVKTGKKVLKFFGF